MSPSPALMTDVRLDIGDIDSRLGKCCQVQETKTPTSSITTREGDRTDRKDAEGTGAEGGGRRFPWHTGLDGDLAGQKSGWLPRGLVQAKPFKSCHVA